MPAGHSAFFDPSGRRWRALCVGIVTIGVVLAVTTVAAWPRIASAPALAPGASRTPIDLPDDGMQVVGRGPLLRVVEVIDGTDGPAIQDPYAPDDTRPLTTREATAVGDSQYVIERFGYAQGVDRTLSLTFDDGPSSR